MGRLIAQQKPDPERQRHKVAEESPEIEKEGGGQENGCGGFHSPRSKQRRDGFPELVEENGHRAKETGEQGEFEDGEEGLGDTEGDQIACQVCVSQVAKQFLRKREDEDPQKNERNEDFEQTLPKPADGLEDFFPFHVVSCNVTQKRDTCTARRWKVECRRWNRGKQRTERAKRGDN